MAVSEQTLAAGKDIQQLSINTIRTLSIDAVQQANSGHPGAPMALAPAMYALWQKVLRYDPADPTWLNRDRFVLSNGHASMLLYSTIFLAGVKKVDHSGQVLSEPSISLDQIKKFRQLDSVTAGHPEYGLAAGIETTTGPLGQGVANSVGMAIAAAWLGARFNRPDLKIFDYNIFAFCGDGDMMEGVASEAASLAGHLRLPNLCWIYDDNKVTLDGPADVSMSEDVSKRFEAYGWNIVDVKDANDLDEIEKAYKNFLSCNDRPTLINLHSHIGYGSPHKQDKSAAHGEPLGEEEVKLVKKNYGWPEDAKFLVPDGVIDDFKNGIGKRGAADHKAWNDLFASYTKKFGDMAKELQQMQVRELPGGWDKDLKPFPADAKGIATRESSGTVLNAIAKNVPWMVGGSADLAGSDKTRLKFDGAGDFQAGHYDGRNLHFGVREHGMGSALNGMTVSGLRAFGGTFFNFSDYMKPAIRLGALMELPVVFIYTHDSIGLGEDGPTHQPIEQLAGLRAIPGLSLFRPADANEVVESWRCIMQLKHEPAALVLSRQALPTLDRTKYSSAEGVSKGAYILADASEGKPEIILISTGSEVQLCIGAYEQLSASGMKARVVSMPSWDRFESQDQSYKDQVFPPEVKARVSVEAAAAIGWDRYVGPQGKILAMRRFGASAPIKDLQKKFGFTVDNVVALAKEAMSATK